jgi:multidrug resistance efflux pump
MSWLRKKTVLLFSMAGMIALSAALGIGGWISGQSPPAMLAGAAQAAQQPPSAPETKTEDEQPDQEALVVNTVQPRHDPTFTMSVEQPAFVTPYYKANLLSRVAGPVKSIWHDKGDEVKAGEVLVEIDMPDLEEDVLQKQALVSQELKKLAVAQSEEKVAAKAVDAAAGLVEVRQADVERAHATMTFQSKVLDRFIRLGEGPSPGMTKEVVDEQTLKRDAAIADWHSAKAMVKEAETNLEEAKAKLEAARADTSMQEAMVRVAERNRDKAKVLLGFATITAPFTGMITERNVDPGSFLHNAATAHSEPLLCVVRTDIVTVYMKVPDTCAPFVKRNTEAIIEVGGTVIRGKVTRKSDTLQTPEHDRTMRVEVDLYNRSAQEYQAFLAREKALGNADLKSHQLPVFPVAEAGELPPEGLGLLPGQFGKMRLILRSFEKAYFLPSSTVLSQGGASYIFLVKNGHAIRVPVEVQGDDGKVVKVAIIETKGSQEIRRELTGSEQVITSNVGELINGQAVHATSVDW